MGYASPFRAIGYVGYIPSATILANHAAQETAATPGWVVKSQFTILGEVSPASGLRLKADIRSNGVVYAIYLKIEVNGVNVYEVYDQTGAYVTKSIDVTGEFARESVIKFYGKSFNGGWLKNMEVCGDLKTVMEV